MAKDNKANAYAALYHSCGRRMRIDQVGQICPKCFELVLELCTVDSLPEGVQSEEVVLPAGATAEELEGAQERWKRLYDDARERWDQGRNKLEPLVRLHVKMARREAPPKETG